MGRYSTAGHGLATEAVGDQPARTDRAYCEDVVVTRFPSVS
jgi:hypothetical protein